MARVGLLRQIKKNLKSVSHNPPVLYTFALLIDSRLVRSQMFCILAS